MEPNPEMRVVDGEHSGPGLTRAVGFATALAYDRHAGEIHGYLVRVVRDSEVAADLCADSFTRLLVEERAGRFPDNPRAWLFRVGSNLAASRGRRLALEASDVPLVLVERRDLEAHLATCPACAAESAAIRHDADRLAALPPIAPPDRVRRSVLARRGPNRFVLLVAAALLLAAAMASALVVGATIERLLDQDLAVVMPTATDQIRASPSPSALRSLTPLSPSLPGRPLNDDPPGTTIDALPFTDVVNTVLAVPNASEVGSSCGPMGDKSVWYSFTARSDTIVAADTLESDYDTVLDVWKGEPAPNPPDESWWTTLVPFVCNDNSGDASQSSVVFETVAGENYIIRVTTAVGAAGGQLEFRMIEP
jgi:DNA-directed RNA polymerase specialized sigma24 family protein